jgi:hypothetical protein
MYRGTCFAGWDRKTSAGDSDECDCWVERGLIEIRIGPKARRNLDYYMYVQYLVRNHALAVNLLIQVLTLVIVLWSDVP